MKFDTTKGTLSTDNGSKVREAIKANTVNTEYQGLLCLLADALDRAASGKDTYVVLGLTVERNAILCTVKEGSSKARAGGATLREVSLDAERLL